MSTNDHLTLEECFTCVLNQISRYTTSFLLQEAAIIYTVSQSIQNLSCEPGGEIYTQEECKSVLTMCMEKLHSQAVLPLKVSFIFQRIKSFFQNPTAKVSKFEIHKWEAVNFQTLVNDLKTENAELKQSVDKLETMMKQMWFAPGMPGFETGKDSFMKLAAP